MHTFTIWTARSLLYLVVIGLTLWLIHPYWQNLILGAITASIFLKLKPRVPHRLRANRDLYAALGTLTALLVLVVPLFLLLILLGFEALHVVQFIQGMLKTGGFEAVFKWLNGIEAHVNHLLKGFGASVDLDQLQKDAIAQLQGLSTILYNQALGLLQNAFGTFLNVFYFLFITFFLIRDGESIMPAVKKLLPFDAYESQSLIDSVEHVGQTVLLGGLLSSAIFGSIMTLIFWLFGFTSPLFWGVAVGILSLIPLGIGTLLVYLPCLIYLLFAKSWWVGVLFIVLVEVIEQGAFYSYIRPQFIDARTQLYPLAIFLAIISGITNFGPLGLVYGPLIMAAFLSLVQLRLHPKPAVPEPEPAD